MASKENFLGAVEYYKKALAADPLYIPAYDGLGKVYFRMEYREEAEREFAIADGLEKIRGGQWELDVALKMGSAMVSKGLYKYAVAYLEPGLKNNSRNPELLKLLGLSYKAMGNDKKARDLFRTVLQRMPRDPDFYTQLASLEIKSGNKKEGETLSNIARLLATVDYDRLDHGSRVELAKIFFNREKFTDAAEFMRQAIALQKSNADYWLFLGQCYHKAGQQPAAADALKKSASLAPSDPRPQKLLAQVYQFLGRFDDARNARQIVEVLEGGRDNAKTPNQAARYLKYLISIGQMDEARQLLSDNLSQWPDSLDLKLIQGRFLVKDKQYEQAINILKSVVETKTDWAEPHIWMAVAYQRLGDNMSALAEGQLATRLAPKSVAIHKTYGDILREQKKFGMAENAYETAENLRATKKTK